ncbi:MAG: glutaredoxin family protein [Candidatus Methanoperedens sp.]|nr:glutaredoxin family protein [Candidatus Methanoperedens sp.]
MYTLSTCPWCKRTKKFFADRKIPFEYTDYDMVGEKEQEKILEEMSKYGGSAFPFVKINGNVVIGYNPEKYSELLGL